MATNKAVTLPHLYADLGVQRVKYETDRSSILETKAYFYLTKPKHLRKPHGAVLIADCNCYALLKSYFFFPVAMSLKSVRQPFSLRKKKYNIERRARRACADG